MLDLLYITKGKIHIGYQVPPKEEGGVYSFCEFPLTEYTDDFDFATPDEAGNYVDYRELMSLPVVLVTDCNKEGHDIAIHLDAEAVRKIIRFTV